MKFITQITSIGVLFLCLAACKKNYTCSCSYSTIESGPTTEIVTDGETKTSYTKVTKKYARESCTSGKDLSTTGSGTNTITVDHVWNCTLE